MLTPIDIQNHSLKTAVRGYSKKETDDFLDEILKGYEELYKENRELKEKVSSLSEGIQYYKQMETTLQKALVLAEKTSAETQEAAKSKADALTSEAQAKADAMLKEAQAKSEALLKEAHSEADGLRKEIQAYSDITKSKANRELEDTRNHVRKLVQSYENYRLQFKKLAESQIEMLESKHYSIFAPELEEMLDGAPDADTVMEAERTVPINVSREEYLEETEGQASGAVEEQAEDKVEAEPEPEPDGETEDIGGQSEPDDDEAEAAVPALEDAILPTAEISTVEPGNRTVFDQEKPQEDATDAPEESPSAEAADAAVRETASAQEPEPSPEEEAKARAMEKIKIPDMEITADTIVPGIKPPQEPKKEAGETPSPFTFIDTE